jgi:hypothetical protein
VGPAQSQMSKPPSPAEAFIRYLSPPDLCLMW